MPKLTQAVATEPTVEQDTALTLSQAHLVRQVCLEYQHLDAQIKVLEHQRDDRKKRLGELRDEAGVVSMLFEGWKVTLVGGLRKVLNKKKLYALGCKKEWYDEAEELKPSKPYERVTPPGAKTYTSEDE